MTEHSPFPPELRTAAIVPRWSVVWTLNKDTVAVHSYFVTIYAYQIASLIHWTGNTSRLMFLALTHDLDETITGDIVSPVKRAIVDMERARGYIGQAMGARMPAIWDRIRMETPYDKEAIQIIECADRLDALLFLTIEKRMGNQHVFHRCQDAQDRFVKSWYELPTDHSELKQLMLEVITPAIIDHSNFGGSGV